MLSTLVLAVYARTLPAVADKAMVIEELERLFENRTRWLVHADVQACATFYDITSRTGNWALEQEKRRVTAVHQWAASRGIQLAMAENHIRVVDAGTSGDGAWGSVCYNLLLTYGYRDGSATNQMGVRTIHWLELARRGERWLIRRDWYWDPFGSSRVSSATPIASTLAYPHPAPGPGKAPISAPAAQGHVSTPAPYNREAAVTYADRYCGVTVAGNAGRYCPRYRDFTFLGGDCTNFVSQVLADAEAGNIPTDDTWCYRNGAPTRAWIQAHAFVQHMLTTGRLECLKKGTHGEVAGAVEQLLPGDVIALEEGGVIEHLMVVVGKDHRGCVLVNSHSADRYHVPWDLGGGRNTIFWLLHVTP